MKISKKEDFSLILMSILAKNYPGKYISLSLVARKAGLSPLFLKHIASRLKNSGLIESKEGVDGGYRLAKDPKDIPIADILQAVSEGLIVPSCIEGSCRVKRGECLCPSFWEKVNERLYSYLKDVSLWEYCLEL